jgi:hypothetical protein
MKTITQSMLGMFLRCPHQFERRYLRGEIIPPGIAARRGSATHKAAQINHEQKLHSREDLPVDHLQDAARDYYVRLISDEGVFIPKDQIAEKDTLLAKGLDAAIRLTKLYRTSLAPTIQPLLVEEKMTMEAGLDLPLQASMSSPLTTGSQISRPQPRARDPRTQTTPCSSPSMLAWWPTRPGSGRRRLAWRSW